MAKTPALSATCPICTAETAARYRPFCSKRCADVDLGRWINGSYSVPTDEGSDTRED
ncbi:MAG: DNA gyrase inhibitor YacG [Paracoccaceae bacterium]